MRPFACVAVFLLLAGSAGAQIPAGAEFHVNTYTTGPQTSAKVASDANGNFVVVWESMARTAMAPGYSAGASAGPAAPGVPSSR
jgi:hypothetical protein